MTGQRTKVFPQRVTGTILDWKGKMGWIKPDVDIQHPEAAKHRGKIYLSIQDVEAELSGVGAEVSFFVYADGSGLGAMNVRPTGGAMPPMHAPAPREGGRPQKRPRTGGFMKEVRESLDGEPMSGTVKSYRGPFGWIRPDLKIEHPAYKGQLYVMGEDCETKELLKTGARVTFTLYEDKQGLGAENVTVDEEAPDDPDGAEGVEEEIEPARPARPAFRPSAAPTATKANFRGPAPKPTAAMNGGGAAGAPRPSFGGGRRQRISELELTGEIIEWENGAGWINPYDSVEHPAAKKRDGKIHVKSADIQGEKTELEPGQLVQFHVYVDNNGLGAEEVLPF